MPTLPFQADSIADLFVRRLGKTPDLVAVSIEGEEATYGEVASLEERIRAAFLHHGIVTGDRVASVTANRIEQYALMIACAMSGVVWCPLNSGLSVDDLARTIDLVQPVAVLAESSAADKLASAGTPGINVIGFSHHTGSDFVSFEDWIDIPGSGTPPRYTLRQSDPFCMIFSGGTTGLPKGILLPAFAPVAGGFRLNEALQPTQTEVCFSTTQLFHAFAVCGWAPFCIAFGHQYVLAPTWSSSRYAEWVRQSGATVIDPFVSMMGMLLNAHRDEAPQVLGPRVAISGLGGADPVATRIRREFETQFGVPLLDTYGSAEAGPTVTRHHVGEEYGPGSSGTSKGWYSIAIVDDQDRELPNGEVGEITIRPELPNISSLGYWRQERETLATRRNLWIHTGDLGWLKPNGELYFVGRQGHFIRRRGEMISAAEIEHVIRELDGVVDVVVVAVPSELGEDDIMACVVADVDAEAIYRWCADKITSFKVPRYISMVNAIPRKPPKQEPDRAGLAANEIGRAWDSQSDAGSRR